jgi:hypothetical protein
VSTPLVINLTDDNDDGAIDLCDVPDVVVSAYPDGLPARIVVLDGETGALHFEIDELVSSWGTPAVGDIDNDGFSEIVVGTGNGAQGLAAFEHDGTLKWKRDPFPWGSWGAQDLALADLDNDGDVEISAGWLVADHLGQTIFMTDDQTGLYFATLAADLDGDQDQEIVTGRTAYHHDGTQYFSAPVAPGFAQVGNFDADPNPEIVLASTEGLAMLEHDGSVIYEGMTPTGDPIEPSQTWDRPATIHDFDGDGQAEFAVSSANHYTVYEGDADIVWSADVADLSGIAGGTAFDFLGDGIAEAMYADETLMFVFDGAGLPLMEIARKSPTIIEYPVVADVDNDGSAEIVVVSTTYVEFDPSPTVQVIRDVEDRWVQARRIWNQHTYHVTNVREDGTIPQFEKPSWTNLNTYRTNAQIEEGGGTCIPPQG